MELQIEIIKPGLLSTVQDLGRFGHRNYAIPQCGALDGLAYYQSNLLVGNPDGTPSIEFNFIPAEIKFHEKTLIALTGADMNWQINGRVVAVNKSLFIKPMDILSGTAAKSGARAYLAIKGDWNIKKIRNSYSTDVNNGFGGHQGMALTKGDRLSIDSQWQSEIKSQISEITLAGLEKYENIKEIKFSPGPEWEQLSKPQQSLFLNTSFSINPESNRMGAKLVGPKLESLNFENQNSNVVFPGIIQWPPGGSPIVLLNDCQTTGGYPRIGIIEKEQLWRFAQIQSNQNFNLTVT